MLLTKGFMVAHKQKQHKINDLQVGDSREFLMFGKVEF
jgi:hypothetical protein